MPRRPLIGLTVGFILGTVLGLRVPVFWGIPFALAVAAWLVAAVGLRMARGDGAGRGAARRLLSKRGVTATAFLAVMVGLGWTRGALDAGRGEGDRGAGWPGPREGRITVTGIVVADPDEARLSRSGRVCHRLSLRIAALDGSAMAPAERPRVDVSWYDFTDAQAPRYGECWTGRAKVKVQPRRGGVHLEIDGRDARYVSGDHGWAMAAWCFRARRAAARYLTMGIEDFGDIKGLLLSLLLGYRGAFPIEARQAFVATGTLHIFAISGSHVAIVTLLGMTALKAARVPRRAWVFVLAPLLAVYAVGTGARSSAVRACLMAATYVAAPALGRRPDGLSSIALAALLILVAVPGQAMDVGFLLSFVVVLVLMILYPRLERVWRPWVEPDPLRVAPENVWRVRGRHVCRYILSLVALSGCATVGSIPLMAYYFEQFTPIGILANVWVVPLAYLIVLAGGLALLLGPIAGVLAVIFNHANLALMAAMAGGMQVLARVPFACCHVPRPPAWSVWLWYAALAALVLAVDRRTRDARADSAPGAPLF